MKGRKNRCYLFRFPAETVQGCFIPRLMVYVKGQNTGVNLRNPKGQAGYPHLRDLKKVHSSCGLSQVLDLFRGKVLGILTELEPRTILRLYYPNHTRYTFGYFGTKVIIEVIVS